MKKTNDGSKNELLSQLADYGYDLSVPKTLPVLPGKVLSALLRQTDGRLLEGFPVVLANALAAGDQLEWEKKGWSPDRFPGKIKERWAALIAASCYLFELFAMDEKAGRRVRALLEKDPAAKEKLAELRGLSEDEFRADGTRLSMSRLKNSFRNYVVHQAGSLQAAREQKESLERELLLSQLFTSRQKELVAKRLAGKPMTKTEKEYYSRVVKKRLEALADPRLHQMARDAVYS